MEKLNLKIFECDIYVDLSNIKDYRKQYTKERINKVISEAFKERYPFLFDTIVKEINENRQN